MIYTTLYISPELTHSSERRHKQAGVFLLDVSGKKENISSIIREGCCETGEYTTLEKLPLCLHKDWKLLHQWECETDEASVQEIVAEFDKGFDRPDIISDVSQTASAYSKYLFNTDIKLRWSQKKISSIYCLNREEYDALNWGYFLKDQDMSEINNDKFVNALVIGKVDKMIDNLTWYNYHCK